MLEAVPKGCLLLFTIDYPIFVPMSRVDLSSAGFSKASLPNGMLQTDSALNTSLQTVKDNVGNSSTLLLSTVDAQFNSTLRIHTDSSELLDIEDTGANNRFNINRVVQKINLDFSSKPTDTTTVVGAIRTATNGSNLADVFTFLENGTVGLNNPSPSSTYKLDIVGDVKASSYIVTSGTSSQFLKADGSLDSTSYTPQSRTITINGLTQDLTANRTWTIATPTLDSVTTAGNTTTNSIAIGTASAPTAKINIKGSGSTSATTSLDVQNSGGTSFLKVLDNGQINMGYAPTNNVYLYVATNFAIGYLVSNGGAGQSIIVGGSGKTLNSNSIVISSGGFGNSSGNASTTTYNLSNSSTSMGALSTINLYSYINNGTPELFLLNDGSTTGINSTYNAAIISVDLIVMQVSSSNNSNIYSGTFKFNVKRYLYNGVGIFTVVGPITNIFASSDTKLIGTTLTVTANGNNALNFTVTLPSTADTDPYRFSATVTVTKVNNN